MKRIFGISDTKNAYFYELDIVNLREIVLDLENLYNVQKKDVALCDFYNYKVHNYGKYQNDINNGYASIIDTNVMHIDKRNTGLQISVHNPCFGVIELIIKYPSQIARVINNTFNIDFCNDQYKNIDFTDMIKVVNSIDNVPNDFKYDSIVDKRLKYMNTSFKKNTKEMKNINKKLFLNEREREISLDEYYNIILKLADNINLKLVATYSLDETYNEEIETMKRYAIRNSKLIEMPIFNPVLKKLEVPINIGDYEKHNKLVKKYQYNDKYNVYLQNADNCDIM